MNLDRDSIDFLFCLVLRVFFFLGGGAIPSCIQGLILVQHSGYSWWWLGTLWEARDQILVVLCKATALSTVQLLQPLIVIALNLYSILGRSF